MLVLNHLTVSAAGKEILHDMTMTFASGKLYALMGPNGSGKSTLAAAVMGHPGYKLTQNSRVFFDQEDITELKPEKRARRGLFLSFQSPLSLSGVTVYQLLRYALDKKMAPLTIRKKVQQYAKQLKIKEELLNRSLNDGFSGGEKKKMEVLQAAMSGAKLIFFDEIDTGVDVDALKTIALFLKRMKTDGKTFILITHYNRILKYLKPDVVMVMINGRLTQIGNSDLAEKIEREGYEF